MGTKKARFLTCLVVVLSTFAPFRDSFAQGDITAVKAGKGLTGGGDTGDVALSVQVPLSLRGSSLGPIISGTNSCGPMSEPKCPGVLGESRSGIGVIGKTDGTDGIAVQGLNASSDNVGYLGSSNYGVYGRDTGSGNYGYIGSDRYGIFGETTNNNTAIYGKNSTSGNRGLLGSKSYGVLGFSASGIGSYGESIDNVGVYGSSDNSHAVFGKNIHSDNIGYLGSSDYGAYGRNTRNGNFGYLGSARYGVYGESSEGSGVYGQSRNGQAVEGTNTNKGNFGALGGINYGVYGSSDHSTGVRGRSGRGYVDTPCVIYQNLDKKVGVLGDNCNGNYGSLGGSDSAVYGYSKFGHAIYGKAGGGDAYAGMFEGNVRVAGKGIVNVLQITGGSDLSEQFEVRGNREDSWPTPGMVVSIDPENPGDLAVSNQRYDRRVAGIISGAGGVKPGMLMGQQGSEADGANPVALSGRVYVRADASKGAIKPGDLLTTSDTPGHAMKVTDYTRAQGAILGKAMSSLESGRGLVLVLVTLQ